MRKRRNAIGKIICSEKLLSRRGYGLLLSWHVRLLLVREVGFKRFNGLFWQSEMFLCISLNMGNRGVLRAFPGTVSGKLVLNWTVIVDGEEGLRQRN
jgi:hypothetical protein